MEGFWNNREEAEKVMGEIKRKKDLINPWKELKGLLDDTVDLYDLAMAEKDESFEADIASTIEKMKSEYSRLRTLALFSEETDELTLSTPTHAELLEINPVLFARQLQRLSTVRFNASNKDNKRYLIDLVPNNQETGIRKFSIKLRKGSLIPEEITVNESSTTTTIRFSEATFDTMMPSFVISKPGAFVNDLR